MGQINIFVRVVVSQHRGISSYFIYRLVLRFKGLLFVIANETTRDKRCSNRTGTLWDEDTMYLSVDDISYMYVYTRSDERSPCLLLNIRVLLSKELSVFFRARYTGKFHGRCPFAVLDHIHDLSIGWIYLMKWWIPWWPMLLYIYICVCREKEKAIAILLLE